MTGSVGESSSNNYILGIDDIRIYNRVVFRILDEELLSR